MDAINDVVSIPIVQLLLGFAAGTVASICVSRYYYRRSSEQLSKEVDQLSRLNVMIMDVLEEAGYVKWARDKQGRPTGKIIELRGSLSGRSSAYGQLEVGYSDAANPAEQGKDDTSADT